VNTALFQLKSFVSNWFNKPGYFLRVLYLCLLTVNTSAQAQAESCFDEVKMEAGFIALTDEKDSLLGSWYKETFGLELVKEFTFPDGSVTGVLMKKDEFVVEIFFRDDAIDRTNLVPKSKEGQWIGFNKFGFYTNADLPQLKACLVNAGIQAGRIWKDKLLGIDLLQIIDPRNNVLEIISRRK